jgi:hypothetical protein
MDKNGVLSLLLAFALGILLTLLLTSRFTDGRYVPFGSTGQQILDTRTGRVYARAAEKDTWLIVVQGVGTK